MKSVQQYICHFNILSYYFISNLKKLSLKKKKKEKENKDTIKIKVSLFYEAINNLKKTRGYNGQNVVTITIKYINV